jgi:peptide/nickel transport system substrate-binding protein/microcin C transport system substrate-binding protein
MNPFSLRETKCRVFYLALLVQCFFISQVIIALPVKKGGELRVRLETYPQSLNYYTGGDMYCQSLAEMVMMKLISMDENTFEPMPALAWKWEMSSDKKTYTFYMNKNAKYSDGKPVTASDVKFTFDLLYDEKRCILCQQARDYIGPLEYVKIIDPLTVQIRAKNVNFMNLLLIGDTYILPQHIFGKPGSDFNKDFEKEMFGAGPYVLSKGRDRKQIILERQPNWWGDQELSHFSEYYNFDRITVRIVKEHAVAFELFKKREIDSLYFLGDMADLWDSGEKYPWTDVRVAKLTAKLNYPHIWHGIAMNMRRSPMNDLYFRQALQLLLNRPTFVKKIFRDLKREVATPFVADSPYSANPKSISYNPVEAAKLLGKAGFTQVGDDGVLFRMVKEGGQEKRERASLELMHASLPHNKWATVFKEDAKKVGVEINIKYLEWTTASKLRDEFQFDAFVMGWGGDPIPTPRQIFHGGGALKTGSSNVAGINHPALNQLIDSAPAVFDLKKRYSLFHEMEKIIITEQPWLFTWTDRDHLVAYWKDLVTQPNPHFYKYTGNHLRNVYYKRWTAAK